MSITFDYGYMLEETVGTAGIPFGHIQEHARDLSDLHAKIQEAKRRGELGFAKLPYDDATKGQIQELAGQIRSECDDLIVIGIGGSDLGARAVHRALNHQFYNVLPSGTRPGPRLFFLGDTTDPVAVQEVLDVVNLKKTIVVIISKSGNTIEQMSTFVAVREQLLAAVGKEELHSHIIAITDAEKGTLRELSVTEGYRTLAVPGDVGGRFSVLSTVGLLVLAAVGIDIDGLLAGAAAMDKHDAERQPAENIPALFALTQYLAYVERGQNISVLMPYAYGLREVGFWFRQLWAESLGKKHDLEGKVVNLGPTPIAAVGPTDQHSQMQLYMEGPYDKVITFISVANPATNRSLKSDFPGIEGVHYLDGHDFKEIILAEEKASAFALSQEGRPSALISLDKLDAYHLGALLYMFELAVAYTGRLLNVDAFDQPGVEIGKRHMYGLLGRKGFSAPAFPESPQGSTVSL